MTAVPMNEPKEGAKGWCQNCGLRIQAFPHLFGSGFRARWGTRWEHANTQGKSRGQHCHWIAKPQPHVAKNKRRKTIPEALVALSLVEFTAQIQREAEERRLSGNYKNKQACFCSLTSGKIPHLGHYWDYQDKVDLGLWCPGLTG